jgi:hypothetical protein
MLTKSLENFGPIIFGKLLLIRIRTDQHQTVNKLQFLPRREHITCPLQRSISKWLPKEISLYIEVTRNTHTHKHMLC